MSKSEKPLLQVLRKEKISRRPVWLMRQAGRYLPEYRKLRAQKSDFIGFCLSPDLAGEASLQPIRRFDLDAVILFADILLVPFSLQQNVVFQESTGPVLAKTEIKDLSFRPEKLKPVYETIGRVKTEIEDKVAFLGFAGGLWTVACYMLQGGGRDGFDLALRTIRERPAEAETLFKKLFEATFVYLKEQIRAGVDAVQIFDSHAGLIEEDKAFDRWVIEPTQKIVAALRKEYPDVPIIGFPRGAEIKKAERYFKKTGVTALGLDQGIPLDKAAKKLKPLGVLQGNLDPALLFKGGEEMKKAAAGIMEKLGPNHIFNLGHGVLPQTPPEHVAELIAFVHDNGERR